MVFRLTQATTGEGPRRRGKLFADCTRAIARFGVRRLGVWRRDVTPTDGWGEATCLAMENTGPRTKNGFSKPLGTRSETCRFPLPLVSRAMFWESVSISIRFGGPKRSRLGILEPLVLAVQRDKNPRSTDHANARFDWVASRGPRENRAVDLGDEVGGKLCESGRHWLPARNFRTVVVTEFGRSICIPKKQYAEFLTILS